jgi:hypothetical protein
VDVQAAGGVVGRPGVVLNQALGVFFLRAQHFPG